MNSSRSLLAELSEHGLNGGPEAPKKKAPGRPRKKPEPEQPKCRGIITVPDCADNHVEFVSQYPAHFKKLATYFRAVGVSELAIVFGTKTVEIQAIDHLKDVHCCTVFDCTEAISYYCESPVTVYTTYRVYEREFHQQDTSIPYVSLILNKSTMRQEIQVQTFVASLGAIKATPLKLISGPSTQNTVRVPAEMPPFDDYCLHFTMETKALKKQLCQWRRRKVYFGFRKIGDRALSIIPSCDNVELTAITFRNTEQIRETSTIGQQEVLDIKLAANSIQPIISTSFAESVSFHLDFDREMVIEFRCSTERKTSYAVTFRINFENHSTTNSESAPGIPTLQTEGDLDPIPDE